MPKKQDWSSRQPEAARITIEIQVHPDDNPEAPVLNISRLEEIVKGYIRHGSFMDGLDDALAAAGLYVEIRGFRIRAQGLGR